jgi:hypothetical protein
MNYRNASTRTIVVMFAADTDAPVALRRWVDEKPVGLVRWFILGHAAILQVESSFALDDLAAQMDALRSAAINRPDMLVFECEMGEARAAASPSNLRHLSAIRRGEL